MSNSSTSSLELEKEFSFSPDFFSQMLQVEQQYKDLRDDSSASPLLCSYTDCTANIAKNQEPISTYFQAKIKEIVHEIRPSLGQPQPKDSDRKKDLMARHVMQIMQEEQVHEKIAIEQKRQLEMGQKVKNIVQAQNDLLEQRRKQKRQMSKSQSATFSFGSLNSSPEERRGRRKSIIKGFGGDFLFEQDIYSEDEATDLKTSLMDNIFQF